MLDLKILDTHSKVFEELSNFSGLLFDQWVTLWNSLSPDEKDIYTHPVYIISWLKSRIKHSADVYHLFIFNSGTTFIGVVPFKIHTIRTLFGKRIYLKSPIVELGSSIAVAKKYRESVCETILNTNIHNRGKPFAFGLLQVDETNSFQKSYGNIVVHNNHYARNIVNLTGHYEELLKNQSRKFRKNLKRDKKKALSYGKLKFEVINKTPDILQSFEQLMDFEMSGWKAAGIKAMRKNEFVKDFYQSVICGFSQLGKSVIFLLKSNDSLLSTHACIIDNNTLYGLKIIYNEEYSGISPGTLLYDYIFREYCPLNEIKCYNSMSESLWFRKKWHSDTLNTYSMFVFHNNLSGNCWKHVYRLYNKFKPTV